MMYDDTFFVMKPNMAVNFPTKSRKILHQECSFLTLSVFYRVSSPGSFGYCAHATIRNFLSAGKGLRNFFFKTEN